MRQLTPLVAAVALVIASPVLAQQSGSGAAQNTQAAPAATTSAAGDAMTVTAYYKQNVYDQNNNKVGQIVDLLMSKDGKIDKVVIGAGGFLGMGKHDVMMPFSSVKMVKESDRDARNNRNATTGRNDRNANANANNRNDYRLVMDTTKDALKNAPGVKYDRTAMTWVPDNSNNADRNRNQGTTGRKSNR
jgi:sporulation protein YlmC with PRC-barrel domain